MNKKKSGGKLFMKIRTAVYLLIMTLSLFVHSYVYAAATSVRIIAPAGGNTVTTTSIDIYGKATFTSAPGGIAGTVMCTVDDGTFMFDMSFVCRTVNCDFSYSQTQGSFLDLWSGTWLLTCRSGGITDTVTFNIDTTQTDNAEGDCGKSKDDPCAKKGEGSPVWAVNKINLNLYATDTPLWYKPPYGPPVDIQLNYNSRSTSLPNPLFSGKWQLGYASHIVENSASSVTVVMPDGRRDTYTSNGSGGYNRPRDVFNDLSKTGGEYTLTFLDGTAYRYAIPAGSGLANHFLYEIRDPYNQPLTIVYDGARISSIRDALNRETTFGYYPNGLVHTVTDPFGRSASFDYDGAGRLQKATDMGGYWASYGYDANGYLSSITTPKGTWTFKTEPSGTGTSVAYPAPDTEMGKKYRLTITNPENGTEEYFYDGSQVWYVSPRDYVNYTDSADNNMFRAAKTYYKIERYPSGSASPKGRISSVTTPERRVETYYYDDSTATNKVAGYSYHNTGRPIALADGNSHMHTYAYNTNGLVTRYWDAKTAIASNPNVELTYSNGVDISQIKRPLDGVDYFTTLAYNPDRPNAHELSSITDQMSYVTKFTYNENGQLSTVTEAADIDILETTTRILYDPVKKTPSTIQKKMKNETTWVTIASLTHDDIDRIHTVTYPDGVVIAYEYDNLNQTKTITYPDGRTESIVNSTLCPYLVDSVTDRAGRTTSYQYDGLKRLFQRDGPEGTYQYRYDANSNLHTFTDANNKVTTFDFDLDNKLSKKTYADNRYVSYTYDPAGLLKTVTNARSQTATYGYDDNDNLTTITYSSGAPNASFGYDGYNRMISSGTTTIGSIAYTYDANDRLKTVRYPWDTSADTITYDYNALNQLTTLTPLLGTAVGYTHDSIGRLKTIKRATDTNSYTYDYITDTAASPLVQKLTRPNGSYTQYEYNDPLKKLTAIINRKSNNDLISRYDYTYTNPKHPDLRNSETINGGTEIDSFTAGQTVYNYGSNVVNQLQSSTNPARTYAYDNDGNMTTAFTPEGYQLTLIYDAENRLTSAQYPGAGSVVYRTEYDYTADGLPAVMRKYTGGELQTTTRYVRAGFLPIQERNASNSLTREYLWGLNYGGGIGGLLNFRQGGIDYNYQYDGKGNVTALINAATQGPVVAYAYDPFGVKMKQVGTFEQPYQFSTKPYDLQTGLSNFGYRYYNAGLGKWMTRDPLGERGGINLYGFVGNNAVNWVDPYGLMILPPNPGGLGGEWTLDPSHLDPNGQRYRDASGRPLDWHPGQQGKPGWGGKDHWHDPNNFGKKHLKPGCNVPDPVKPAVVQARPVAAQMPWWQLLLRYPILLFPGMNCAIFPESCSGGTI
jgi:RHS repeat-associated protein